MQIRTNAAAVKEERGERREKEREGERRREKEREGERREERVRREEREGERREKREGVRSEGRRERNEFFMFPLLLSALSCTAECKNRMTQK